jgi:integrase
VKPKGWIKHSPALYLEHRKGNRDAVPYLTVVDAKKFLEAAETHDPALVPLLVLSLFAGIRPSAAVRMAPFAEELIDLDEKWILIPHVHRGVEINKAQAYRVEGNCPDAIWRWLKAYWDGGAIDIRNHEGRRQAIIEHAGIVWVHDAMRHSFATYAFRLEGNIEKVATWLGHTDSRLTKRHYANPAAKQKHAQVYFGLRPKEGAKPVVREKKDPHAARANWPCDSDFRAWCRRERKTHVAAILGVSEAAVRKRLKRILDAESDASA